MSATSTEPRQVAAPPRVVAISGVIFSALYIASLMLVRLAVPACLSILADRFFCVPKARDNVATI